MLRAMYVLDSRDGTTSHDFRLPKDSAIYEARTSKGRPVQKLWDRGKLRRRVSERH